MAAELKNKIKRASTTESRDDSVPRTVEELRSLTVRIGRGKAEFSLGVKAHHKFLFVVERCAFNRLDDLNDGAKSKFSGDV